MNKTFDDIVLLRAIATVLVVISHCLYIYTYGPLSTLQVPDLTFFRWLVTDFIVKCNMPLFVFMSGFLFAYQYHEKRRFVKFSNLIKSKSKRLLLPYLVMLPLTIISLNEPLQLNLLTLLCPIGHLWFLMMLFGCMIAGWVIMSLKLDKPKAIIPLMGFLYILAAAPPPSNCGIIFWQSVIY